MQFPDIPSHYSQAPSRTPVLRAWFNLLDNIPVLKLLPKHEEVERYDPDRFSRRLESTASEQEGGGGPRSADGSKTGKREKLFSPRKDLATQREQKSFEDKLEVQDIGRREPLRLVLENESHEQDCDLVVVTVRFSMNGQLLSSRRRIPDSILV